MKTLAPTRKQPINKGMVSEANHGDTVFTAPMFDGFMWRIMPGTEW